MGCSNTKLERRSTEIDLFAAADEKPSSETTESQGSETNAFTLTDEYTYDELDKVVFDLGSDCVADDDAGAICGRISSVNHREDYFGQKYLQISLMTIKSNGKVFFRSEFQSYIGQFTGRKKLSELDIRPVLPKEKSKLKERGRVFAKCGLGAHYMMYSEKMLLRGCLGTSQISAEGRVMVDTSSFLHFNPNYSALGGARRLGHGCGEDYEMFAHCDTPNKMSSLEIPESSLHLCWPTLCGFSLKAKRWGEIAVASLSDINFSDDAFSKLVLDPQSKGLVKSLVENIHSDMFTDIIQGKGGGCIFLLHGPPGTGKTLTAEAVSEILHRPLYCVDVGELGITPEVLEDRLKKILEVAERWNAVVLVDECDIFLASRNKEDVLRNAMVGIFLRLLEYYNGVLFLTSNRADDLDEAFQSRISVSLEYKILDTKTRTQVWSNLLDAAGISGLDVDKLGEYELNGRQIKTAIRLAVSLAKTAKETINHGHLQRTISYANVMPREE